jgi:glycosidase
VTPRQDIRQGIIYQIFTDRFFDGDTTNNNPAQSAGMYDSTHTNYGMYWGGDLAGIQQKIPYLKSMGVQAIWISPPVDNANLPVNTAIPYHGYHARDFKRIEEHFGDSSNTWAAFDALVTAAHAQNIKVIVDFAPNHTNIRTGGEAGALYDNGTLFASYTNDATSAFHHTPNIGDYNDRYQLQYYTLADLADLDQENPAIDQYLKDSAKQFLAHGADGFRFDAVKHANWGWEYSLTDTLNAAPSAGLMPPFLFGEWMEGYPANEPLYQDSVKFARNSGMSLLDYPLATAIRDVFANGHSFRDLDALIAQEAADFGNVNDLVTFFDNHDIPRFLSLNNNQALLQQALTFLITARGTPVVLYGDEQYLHNDTNGGGDPYNRVWMTSFDTSTLAFNLVQRLAALRSNNNALAYGTMKQRWLNDDVYIYERQFGQDVVLVALNKSATTAYNIGGLLSALPAGTYTDYFGGYFSGVTITVSGSSGNNSVSNFTLAKNGMAIWQATGATVPRIGAVTPLVAAAGTTVALTGENFGTNAGTVQVGGVSATVLSWNDSTIKFSMPAAPAGQQTISVTAPTWNLATLLTVRAASLIPVRFTVTGVPTLASTESLFITGNIAELGNWATTFQASPGPMLGPNPPEYFLVVSVPAGADLQFKFFRLAGNGTVTQEGGLNHAYTVPASGVGSISVTWQP